MNAPGFQRLLVTLLPAALLLGLASVAMWGDSGVLVRQSLVAQLTEAEGELERTERENQRLIRELQLMETDQEVLERVIADELGLVREGTTVIRFQPSEDGLP